ncbi:MAG TPA: ribbon-helix-helix domain-containing protein [Candidatus Saccharimonadales bacterium]|nr:ribbon-helix-helix domain-containing protein [Candidatus Saccharimonadales bacterium]
MNTKTFNVSMPNDLVKKIDRQAKSQGSNRSDFIRQAVRKQLDVLEMWDKAAAAARRDYKGPVMNEEEVADLIRAERAQSSK